MRLQRGQFVSWLVGVAVMAAVVGAIARSAGDFATTDAVREYLTALGGTQQVADAFVAAEIALLGTIIAAYGVHATLRLRVEEAAGRVDALLAAGVDRVPWALSYVAAAAVAVAVLALVGGFTTGLTYGLALGDLGEVGALTAAALAHVPASWVLIGIAAAAFGWAPRAAVPVTWALYGAFVVVAEFGPLWGLPLWIRNLAPFTHSPLLPGGETSWTGLGALTITSVALVLVGLLRWHRRDIGA